MLRRVAPVPAGEKDKDRIDEGSNPSKSPRVRDVAQSGVFPAGHFAQHWVCTFNTGGERWVHHHRGFTGVLSSFSPLFPLILTVIPAYSLPNLTETGLKPGGKPHGCIKPE